MNEYAFTKAFMRLFLEIFKRDAVNQNKVADIVAGLGESSQFTMGELFQVLSRTSGYPYLVSAICKIMDEELPKIENFRNPAAAWTKGGVTEAVKLLLKYEMYLLNLFISEEAVDSAAYQCGDRDGNQFVRNGRFT